MKARVLGMLLVLALVTGACSRSGSEQESSGDGGSTSSTTAAKATSGSFGSLQDVCGPGDAKGATDQGVSDDTIRVGTISDVGFAGRQGLNQEFFDVAKVFTDWCNAAGGIEGRKVQADLLDAKVSEYRPMILSACNRELALVGGGGVLDDTGEPDRLKCLLPNLPGFVVSAAARDTELIAQPAPNPLNFANIGIYRWLADKYPEAAKHVATLTASVGSTLLVERQTVEAAKAAGMDVSYRGQYNALGEPTWAPIAQKLKTEKARGLLWTGEPEGLALLQRALDDIGYQLDFVLAGPNHYDQHYLDSAGASARNTFMSTGTVPFEEAKPGSATQQYLDLFAKYEPNGKARTQLGISAFSAWLIFAEAAKACGSELTRGCLYREALRQAGTAWTGGGLQSATDVEHQTSGSTQPACFTIIKATPKGFVVIDPDGKGDVFSCSRANSYTLTGDYGKGPRLADFGLSLANLK